VRALLSVYDKTGVIELAKGLEGLGIELVSSGGTSKALAEAGIAHREVAEVTGSPEMLDGRVKTLHPAIHGGILADRSKPAHLADLARLGIEPIDLVVCNLYPFSSDPSIELIDVGGPTMVRAAAKNHDSVAVVTNPADYGVVLGELQADGAVSAATRRRLARDAFAHTAAYDAAIVAWFDSVDAAGTAGQEAATDDLPATIEISLERAGELRYGENPHQVGARYRRVGDATGFWDHTVQHGGRELSYLNLFDAEAAWRLVHELVGLDGAPAAVVIVKHANPCGAAVDETLGAAYERAFDADPISAFGGIVAFSGHVDLALAESIVSHPLADVLIAPSIAEEAIALFGTKRKNMRALVAPSPTPESLAFRQIAGGFLVQEPDTFKASPASWTVATLRQPTAQERADAELAWRVCARTTSNAIVLAKAGQIVGVGCGQQNRVDAAGLALRKADGRAAFGAAASDAFFPFRDGLDACIDSGVSVVVQPGGSLRDDEVIAAANERGIVMFMTGERHFRH
jgi:phosphoribosylaminoimidazolecarboxamide formyltransferase/IMP cyclohydrolase